MSAATTVSVEDYLRRTEKPSCEYVDGVLYPKALATTVHGLLEVTLALLLQKQGLQAAPEVTVRLTATKYLVPDVIAAPTLQRPYPTEPVLLCAEILSPEDRVGAVLAKCEQYHAWGVPFCWVIDPEEQTGWQYDAGSKPKCIDRGGRLTAGQAIVQLEELFAEQPR
jgi:Uma2 family endonuclease